MTSKRNTEVESDKALNVSIPTQSQVGDDNAPPSSSLVASELGSQDVGPPVDKDELRKRYEETQREWQIEALEKLRILRETPITEVQRPDVNAPRISFSLSGPRTLSLSAENYPLTVSITHHSNRHNLPFTFREYGSPISPTAPAAGVFLLYRPTLDEEIGSEAEVEGRNTGGTYPYTLPPLPEPSDTPLAVTPATGFAVLNPGATLSRTLNLPIAPWREGLSVGDAVDVLMPHGSLAWWSYMGVGVGGTYREVLGRQRGGPSIGSSSSGSGVLVDQRVSESETRPDGGLVLTRSNAVRVEVVR